MKYAFTVAPGTDVTTIRMAYSGARGRLTSEGAVILETPVGPITDPPPVAYQERDGRLYPVEARFAVIASSDDRFTVGFRVGEYDRTLPLVIDPALPVFAGFMGGAGDERGLGVAVDASGAAYVTGQSPTPFTQSPDAFVAKVAPDGRNLVYVSFIGGTSVEAGFDVAVDAFGQATSPAARRRMKRRFPSRQAPTSRSTAASMPSSSSSERRDRRSSTPAIWGVPRSTSRKASRSVPAGYLPHRTHAVHREDIPREDRPGPTFNGHYDAFLVVLSLLRILRADGPGQSRVRRLYRRPRRRRGRDRWPSHTRDDHGRSHRDWQRWLGVHQRDHRVGSTIVSRRRWLRRRRRLRSTFNGGTEPSS